MCNTQKKSYYTCDVTRVQSATQWAASVHTLHTLHTSRNLGWGGGVGWGAMTCIVLAHMFDATQLHLRTCYMPRNCTCAHVRCYAIALAHMFDATQSHLRTCSMLRNRTCAHVRCYAIVLAHMFDATQLYLRTSPRSCPKQWKPTKRKAKECLQMSANFSKRGSSNGHGVLNSCV